MEDTVTKMANLIIKWKGKPEASYMSREWIERRADRSRYLALKAQLKNDLAEVAKRMDWTK